MGWAWGGGSGLIWEGSRSYCVGITKGREGGGEGGKKSGGEAQTQTVSGGGILYCQAPALGRKVVGYYADASLKPSEGPPLATKYEPVCPQLHTTT